MLTGICRLYVAKWRLYKWVARIRVAQKKIKADQKFMRGLSVKSGMREDRKRVQTIVSKRTRAWRHLTIYEICNSSSK